ncbi:MAG: quinolinate synthase NadA [Actinomycetota bacterium]|jgi:quinolinate synthase|nr:quinolinate synthase NadA [Actinomycetota bacterium]
MNKSIELIENINKLRKENDAVILAHNYQIGEVQDIADFVGDSLELSIKASEVKKSTIVFCGVKFMAETAKILNPGKKVLLPDNGAGCPMADMINAKDVKKLREEHPDAVIVCYVNSTAEVKALVDICCTSANAVKVVSSIPEDKEIIFIPDKYLGTYVMSQTGRKMILWRGYCPTHVMINAKMLIQLKKEHLGAEILVHPECTPEVTEIADKVLSTGGMLRHVQESSNNEFIIGTEIGIIHRLQKLNPKKIFYPAQKNTICPNMKLINLEKIMWSLEDNIYEINLSDEIIEKARTSLEKMTEFTG